jgi:hypothetical protein
MSDEDILALVRYLLGGITTTLISDTTLTFILDRNRKATDCETIYATVLETLLYLDRTTTTSPNLGSVVGYREKEGNVEYEERYAANDTGATNTWRGMYDDFLVHPEWVCPELAKDSSDGTYYYIGGVSKSDRDAVNDNKDSIGTGTKIGFVDDLVK